jgi:hypothetical protein
MQIVVIKHTGYSIEFIKRMNIFAFLDLWETTLKLSKNANAK